MAINKIKPRQICETGLIALAALAAILLCVYLIWLVAGFFAYGDDSESDLGLCLRHYQRYCDKLDIEKITDQILERAKEWNNRTCDFSNNTCENIIAPQIQQTRIDK